MKKRFIKQELVNIILAIFIVIETFDTFYGANFKDNTTFSNSIQPNIVFTSYEDVTIPTESEILAGKSTLEVFNYYIEQQKFIMHAGGSIDGKNYTNSYEAIKNNYDTGNRIFEIDLQFTSDNHLVLVHGWEDYDYKNKLGVPYNKKNPVMSLNTFKNTKIHDKYKTMTIEDLVTFMKNNPYSYFILNIKGGSNVKTSTKAIKQVINAANNNRNILNRFIIWGYNTKVIKAIKQLYNFELIALNVKPYSTMEKSLNTEKELLTYCKNNNIKIIMYQYYSVNKDTVLAAKKENIKTFVYTIDNKTFAEQFFKQGIDMAFTNKLRNEK